MSSETPTENVVLSPPNSTMAIVSLIAGILGLTVLPLIGGVVALFTGYSARREIDESYGELGGEGYATAGIVMGWISLALAGIGCLCVACSAIIGFSIFGITSSQYGLLLAALI
jgi:hypothetical protein